MGLRAHNFNNTRRPRYPAGTLTFYGPNASQATKAVAAVFKSPGSQPQLKKWQVTKGDLRKNQRILQEAAEFFKAQRVWAPLISEQIAGCPHEQGVDYTLGEECPSCPYWAARPRGSGEIEH